MLKYFAVIFLTISLHAEDANPLVKLTKMTELTQLAQLKSLFQLKSEPKSDDVMVQIHDAAVKYVERHSNSDDEKKWNKKFKKRIDTRAKDSNIQDNEAANELVMDWIAPRRFQKDWDGYECLEMCRMLLYYTNKEWVLPEPVGQHVRSKEGSKNILANFAREGSQ